MAIAHLCRRQFTDKDWSRGQEYFRRNKVSIYAKMPDGLEAIVVGSEPRPYQVSLDWSKADDGVLIADCSCPRFQDVAECKHVVATILEADRTNATMDLTALGSLEVLPYDELDDDDDLEDDSDDEYPVDRWSASAPRNGASRRDSSLAANQPKMNQPTPRKPAQVRETPLNWKIALTAAGVQPQKRAMAPRLIEREQRVTCYLLDLKRTAESGKLAISIKSHQRKKDGTHGVFRAVTANAFRIESGRSPQGQQISDLLEASNSNHGWNSFGYGGYSQAADYQVNPSLHDSILPLLAATGNFLAISRIDQIDREEPAALKWDSGPAWKLRVVVTAKEKGSGWEVRGKLERQAATGELEIRDLAEPKLLLRHGLVIFHDHLARYEQVGDFAWTLALRKTPVLQIPAKEEAAFVAMLANLDEPLAIDLPESLQWREETAHPEPRLDIVKPKHKWDTQLTCYLSFAYGERIALHNQGEAVWFDSAARVAFRRNWERETVLHQKLLELGIKPGSGYGSELHGLRLAPKQMPAVIKQLTSEGWQVFAEGKAIRKASNFAVSVSSTGLDWFDVSAKVDFGDTSVSLPRLLQAMQKDDGFIELDDGSKGLLPEAWLQRYGSLGRLGKRDGDKLGYTRTQAALLDVMLAEDDQTRISIDKTFTQLRHKLRSFSGVKSVAPPASFRGELRPYQKEGLGWLHYLDEFGFGGCLADDMGLGKTVQVLAMLEKRRLARARSLTNSKDEKKSTQSQLIGPSLIVVPKSLVFNWVEEAKRFTPKLKVLNFTGLDRRTLISAIPEHDVVITTYSTMRLEIEKLREQEFDYVILDEAQAIKNSQSQAAKASLLLKGRRRLAMSGTPIENHLGELASLLEFLNPGLLGSVAKLSDLFASEQREIRLSVDDEPSSSSNGKHNTQATDSKPELNPLAKALRPFLLRRTKSQVLKDLPAKTEQTLYCELPVEQRALYDELRQHYRASLLSHVSKVGLKKSKIQVLEALLRLRQAACHPGLLNEKQRKEGSAKLEALMEHLAEIVEEGHKVLVFSQFTKFLSIVRDELDKQKITYEYLDGKTTKRQAKVERFQTDPNCPLFLISLKAGGLGLNLTAADYVFILDPWWNPAVEAQAVDRAHRLGQKKHVFAYRLIAKDTVEEKILALQQQKRQLADAIISADSSIIQNLTTEDLQLLLS